MEPEQKPNGALVGLIIIIVILIIGGVYLWKKNTKSESVITPPGSEENGATVEDLEANLESIDLESLDSEI